MQQKTNNSETTGPVKRNGQNEYKKYLDFRESLVILLITIMILSPIAFLFPKKAYEDPISSISIGTGNDHVIYKGSPISEDGYGKGVAYYIEKCAYKNELPPDFAGYLSEEGYLTCEGCYTYKGELRNGKREGEGVTYYSEGILEQGFYEDDILIERK